MLPSLPRNPELTLDDLRLRAPDSAPAATEAFHRQWWVKQKEGVPGFEQIPASAAWSQNASLWS
jgi:hypothetical protein